MNIFFDLDGTLLDSRERLFRLFTDLTGQTLLEFEDYWDLKRSMYDHSKILSTYLQYTEENILLFKQEWLNLIETEYYLLLDKPFLFSNTILSTLEKQGHKLYLITARQSKVMLLKQLKMHNLDKFFSEVLVTEAVRTKTQLIIESELGLSASDLYVGDTGVDIQTAKQIGVRSMAVLSGFRNRTILLSYKPDYIENDIQTVFKYV